MFRGRPGDVVKAIWWDGQGSGLFSKRLERGRFVWPAACEGQGGDDAGASRAMLLEGWGGPANGPGHQRRLQSAKAFIKLAMIHLMLRRLARSP